MSERHILGDELGNLHKRIDELEKEVLKWKPKDVTITQTDDETHLVGMLWIRKEDIREAGAIFEHVIDDKLPLLRDALVNKCRQYLEEGK